MKHRFTLNVTNNLSNQTKFKSLLTKSFGGPVPTNNNLFLKPYLFTNNVEKKQALEVERHYILNYPCINKKIPLQTKKEYENRTPESKDKIRGSRNCVCGRVYTVDHKNRHLNSKIHMKGMDKIFYLNKKNILL